jgi:hypothetical protein
MLPKTGEWVLRTDPGMPQYGFPGGISTITKKNYL